MTTIGGQFIDLDAPLSKINVHLRSSFIIPMQSPGTNLMSSRTNPFSLLVALTTNGDASGALYWDDGDSIGKEILSTLLFALMIALKYHHDITTFLFRVH